MATNAELTEQVKELTAAKDAAEAKLAQYEKDAAEVERRVSEIMADSDATREANDLLREENEAVRAEVARLRSLAGEAQAPEPNDPDASPKLETVTEDGLCALHFPDGWESANAKGFDSVGCEHGHFTRKASAE